MSNFANPELENSFLKVILASNTPAAPAVVFANDLTKGLYWDINGLHLTGLSASPTDDTEAASKAYVDAQAGGGGANTALSNLASTAVNAAIIPDANTLHDLGTASLQWKNLNLGQNLSIDADGSNLGQILWNSDPGTHIGFVGAGANDFRLETYGGACFLRFQPTVVSLAGPVNGIQLDNNATPDETTLLLWDITAATYQRVSIGAADSGGTGFRVLRIPN